MGFGDDDFISYIFWGKSVFSPVYDIATESQNSVNFTALDSNTIAGFYISDVVPIGDINGDGFDDLAISTSDKIIVLYGMQNWQTIYEDSAGLNTLEISTGAYADIYALGDVDGDGKDEFGYTYTTGEAASINDGLIIWNGSDTPSEINGFSVSLKQNYFSIDENISGTVIGRLELDGNTNINNYDLIIQSVSLNGQDFDGDLFELASDGTLKLLDGVFLNADEYSELTVSLLIVDQANDQISNQLIFITVNNINEHPSINLSNRFVDDKATAESVIGTLSGTDPDNDLLTYILTGIDADKFIIDAATNEIKFADGVVVDVTDQVSYSITITAKDPYGLESSEQVVIEVNVAPTDITLETNIIQESVRGAAIGQITVSDKNETDEFTYTISGEDSWMFNITSEGILELAGSIYADFESEEILNITIMATDILGQSVSKDFSINTVDINYSNPEISDTIFSNFVIPLSGDPYIDSMLFGFTLDPDNDFNTSLTITYSIPGTNSIFIDPYYYEGSGYEDAPNNIVNPSNSFIAAIDEIFTYIGNLLGINFVKVEETNTVVGDIRCAITDLPDAGWGGVAMASGDYLGNLDNYFFLNGSTDSDIWLNFGTDIDNIVPGTWEYSTIIHEIGHVLGLKHPQQSFHYTSLSYLVDAGYSYEAIFNYYLSSSSAPELNYADVDHLYASIAPQYLPRLYNSLDWTGYSIMSYDEYPGEDWGSEGIITNATDGHSVICSCSSCRSDKNENIIDVSSGQRVIESSFMSLDILALMYIYNYDPSSETWNIPSFNSGDDTYVIDGPVFMTIHDTGGKDTIDLSAFNFDISFNLNFFGPTWDDDTNQYILTYQHNEIGSDLLEYADGEFYSGYILNASPFTIIEDLILGSGNDSVLASFDDTINNIEAGSGNDSVYYIGALDTVYGEEGDDYFQATLDTFTLIDGGIGVDTLTIDQALLDSGLYSVDLRGLNQGQVNSIELLNYGSDQVIGKGQILISGKTFT